MPPSAQFTGPYTLHVYSRHVQISTLVLGPDHQQLPPIDRKMFNISLDSGPTFHPTHIRREGDDPINLAILLDVSGNESDLLPHLNQDFSKWVSSSLKPNDRVSIYAVDCALLQTSDSLSPDPAVLQRDLSDAILSPRTHGSKAHASCHKSLNLRDSMAIVMQRLSQLPGHRILLVVSPGHDGGSTLSWTDVRIKATYSAVVIFQLINTDSFLLQESTLTSTCQLSGGISLRTTPHDLPQTLHRFTDMLRDRYILSFPEPANPTPGSHFIKITIENTDAFIATSGVTVPLPDPAVANDPTTVPSNNPDAPKLGNHPPTAPQP
jgi:hypothetical protein